MSKGFHASIEQVIVDAAARGDSSARETIYRQFANPVFTLARRMLGESAAAEDILQDSFLDAFDKLPAWRGDAPLGMWIRRIAINRCLMHQRAHWQSRREALSGREAGIGQQSPEAGHDLARLLDALNPEDRMVLWLKEVEGYSHAEIAQLCEQSVSYSKSRLARAHERLREMLSEEVKQCTQQHAS